MNKTPESTRQDPEPRVFRVLFVCTGNTCRSPMAEGILRKLAGELPADGPRIEAASAGTIGMVGAPATPLAVAVAAEYGVDIRAHRSQEITKRLLEQSDLILALSAEHFDLCRGLGAADDRVFMLRSFPHQVDDRVAASIADPMGGDRAKYERAYFEIDEAIRRALPGMLERAAAKS